MRAYELPLLFFLVLLLHRYGPLVSHSTRLPSITLCLSAGAAAVASGALSHTAAAQVDPLHQAALALITFAAGSHLEVGALRSNRRAVLSLTVCFTGCTLAVVGIAALALAPAEATWPQAAAAATLAAVVSIARSASSAIGVVSEEAAEGPYTQTMLTVTMVTDAVVIVLFATAATLAEAALGDAGGDAAGGATAPLLAASALGRTALRLALSLAHAAVLAALCVLVLRLPAAPAPLRPCSLGLVAASAFATESGFHRLTRGTELASFVRLEPMLSCASRSHFSLSANFT